MYQKYQTEALVLESRERGEADRAFALYTRDFGLVWARASGVRKESSLMRFALQRGSCVQVGLVRGKNGWRIAGASRPNLLAGTAPGASTFARISLLMLRLVRGEGENTYLFDTLANAQEALRSAPKEMAATVEVVCVARMLYALGYLSVEGFETLLFTHTSFALPEIEGAKNSENKLLSSINKAIAETQL